MAQGFRAKPDRQTSRHVTTEDGSGESRRRSDSGASLILALVYIVAISLIVGALADWAMNDLNNSSVFQNKSSLQYAATGTVQVAIQSIRYTPGIAANPTQGVPTPATPTACWTPSSGTVSYLTINGYTVGVWCQTKEQLASNQTRVVTFYACQYNPAQPITGAQCKSDFSPTFSSGAVLEAIVAFDDYPSGGHLALTATCPAVVPPSAPQCGYSATTLNWIWPHA